MCNGDPSLGAFSTAGLTGVAGDTTDDCGSCRWLVIIGCSGDSPPTKMIGGGWRVTRERGNIVCKMRARLVNAELSWCCKCDTVCVIFRIKYRIYECRAVWRNLVLAKWGRRPGASICVER